jgi:hypothetical protein
MKFGDSTAKNAETRREEFHFIFSAKLCALRVSAFGLRFCKSVTIGADGFGNLEPLKL